MLEEDRWRFTRPRAVTPTQDILVRNEGSIVLLEPKTPKADSWLEEHLDPDAMMFGPAYAVEPRYVAPIVDGAIADGLKVGAST